MIWGSELNQNEKKLCSLTKDATECPNCGCPVNSEITQKVEITGVKFNKKVKIISRILIVILLGIGIIALGIHLHKKKQYNQKISDYSQNLRITTYTMLDASADAEKCCNLIKSVWYNTIYEKTSSETDK